MMQTDLSQNYIKLPVDLLIQIHESASADVRQAIEQYLGQYKDLHGQKEHLAEGFFIDRGKLCFSEELYREACYRGKIETRTRLARESYDKLKSEIELLGHMGVEQKEALADVAPAILSGKLCCGEPVSSESLALIERIEQVQNLLPK